MSASANPVSINFRMGEERDAEAIARFYNSANAGLSEVWWSSQAHEGESWLDAFVRDIKTPDSIAHYQRVVLAEDRGKVVGLLIAFPQDPLPPSEYLQDLPSSELNILELRRLVEGSMFIAVVAVDEAYRRLGIARHFINMSMQVAANSGLKEASIIIHENNTDWLESFKRRGFAELARKSVGNHATFPNDTDWVLLTSKVSAPQQQVNP